MVNGNELFVIARMTNGDQVMACLNNEDTHHVEFGYPILIRMIPTPFPNRETIAATPYCQFSDDTTYIIDKRNIMFIKRLHPSFVPHFLRFANEYEHMAERVEHREDRSKKLEEIFEGEGELSVEEINRRMQMLEAIAGMEETTDEEDTKYIVSGNDTLH
jgi:hypothetical protein